VLLLAQSSAGAVTVRVALIASRAPGITVKGSENLYRKLAMPDKISEDRNVFPLSHSGFRKFNMHSPQVLAEKRGSDLQFHPRKLRLL